MPKALALLEYLMIHPDELLARPAARGAVGLGAPRRHARGGQPDRRAAARAGRPRVGGDRARPGLPVRRPGGRRMRRYWWVAAPAAVGLIAFVALGRDPVVYLSGSLGALAAVAGTLAAPPP